MSLFFYRSMRMLNQGKTPLPLPDGYSLDRTKAGCGDGQSRAWDVAQGEGKGHTPFNKLPASTKQGVTVSYADFQDPALPPLRDAGREGILVRGVTLAVAADPYS